MAIDPRNPDGGDLPDEFINSLESYVLGVISIEKIRCRIGALLNDNQDWGPDMLTAIDAEFQRGHLNGTAYRTLVTEIDLGTSEDEPTEWSEETRAEVDTDTDADADADADGDADADAVPDAKSDTDEHRIIVTATPDANDMALDEPSPEPVIDRVAIGPGTLLRHRYVLHEKIGTGSMGDVYKALDCEREADDSRQPWIAVKVISQQFAKNPNAIEALKQEVSFGQRLDHPNIIRVFDLDWEDDEFFMTMEWLEGTSLVALLKGRRFQPLPLQQASVIIQGLCHGLAHAHAQGIVHADVKPGNILITRAGHAKLLDFGIARTATAAPDDFDATSIGAHTPAYSSCEVLEGATPTAADDVFSLACIAYRLLAGRRTFGGTTALKAESRNLGLQRIESINESQWRALQGALAWRREQRTPDVETFLAEFSAPPTANISRPMPAPAPVEPERAPAGFQGIPLKYGVPALAATLAAIALVLWWPQAEDVDRLVAPPVPDVVPPTGKPAREAAEFPATVQGPTIENERVTREPAAASPRPDSMIGAADAVPAARTDKAVISTRNSAPAALTGARQDTGAEHFESLLDAAHQRMDNGRLTESTSDITMSFITELEAIAPDSPELRQTRLRLANLMLLEAMVAIADEKFSVAGEWIAQTRALGITDAVIARYETELTEARAAKATRDSETLGAIFASATPAAILANPERSFEPGLTLAMVGPDTPPERAGSAAMVPANKPAPAVELPLMPLSELKFRRFVEPRPPPRTWNRVKNGWVELRFRVDEKGETTNIRVVESEPPRVFDQAALAALQKWRFEPYRIDGKATAIDSGVRLRFEN